MIDIQKQIYWKRAGIPLNEDGFPIDLNEAKLSDAEIEKILNKLHAEDEKELEQMNEDFDDFEEYFTDLNEAKKQTGDASPIEGKVSSDTKGKMHELLVGYHLLGGKHMEKHPDKNGDSPEEAHDRLKKTVHPNDYKKINDRAKSAAADIKKKIEVNGHKIHQVHWTSQPNDLLRTTGIKADQKQDSSDIVVTTHKK